MMGNEEEQAISGEVSWSSATIDILSPKKLLVESATMIYIISFIPLLFCRIGLERASTGNECCHGYVFLA